MRFRKITTVEAVQWNGWPHKVAGVEKHPQYPQCGWVKTLEGGHEVTAGDWILTGIKGEKWPCKPDVFAMTYEAADEGIPDPKAAIEAAKRSLSSARECLSAIERMQGLAEGGEQNGNLGHVEDCVELLNKSLTLLNG